MIVQVDRTAIESSLRGKGFVGEDSHHRYFYHEVEGKRTGISTHTSHGSQFKTYEDNLLKQMRKQLRLDTLRQLRDLLECPMTEDDYNDILRKKGLI